MRAVATSTVDATATREIVGIYLLQPDSHPSGLHLQTYPDLEIHQDFMHTDTD